MENMSEQSAQGPEPVPEPGPEPGPEPTRPAAALHQNRVFLDLFWDLAKPEQEVRLRAVDSLVQYLQTNNKEEELEYTLKRLVDGLSHSRESARPAFSLALGQVLSAFKDISLLQTLDRIRVKYNLLTVKKKLQRSAMFGSLFGVLALHQSGRLTQDPQVVVACVQLLQSLTPHRQHLKDLPTKTMMDILNQVEEEVFEQVLFSALQSDLSTPFKTPEQLHLLLVALQRFPHTLKPKKLKKLLGFSTIIHQDNVPRLTELLKTVANSVKKEHVLPPVMLDLLKLSLREDSFQLFWTKVISEGLLKEPPGPCHYLSFRLLGAALPLFSDAQLQDVLKGDLMRQYGLHLLSSQKPGRFQLAPEMDMYVSTFLQGCEDADRQLLVLRGFSSLCNQGCPLVPPSWKVVQHLHPSALQAYTAWLFDMFLRPQHHLLLDVNTKKPRDEKEDRPPWVHRLRKWIGARLVALVDNQQLKKEEVMVLQVSRFLLFHAFFSTTAVCAEVPESAEQLSVPLQEETRATMANSFFSLLLSLHHLPQEQGTEEESAPHRRPQGVRADGSMWICHIFEFAQMLLQQQQHVEPGPAFGPAQRDAWDSLLQSVSSLRKKMKKVPSPENKAFLQLFLLVGLHLFKAPEEMLDIIRDLQSCVERANKKKRRSKPGEEEEPAWIEVLVELLLSLLSQPSRHMRQVCKMVFSSVCPHITEPALSAILKVLEPELDEADSALLITDDNPGLSREEEEEEEEEDKEEQGEEGEEGSQEEGSGSDLDDEENVDADDDEDEDEEELQEDVDPEFRLRLMKVLEQQNALAKEEDSSGDEDLGDEEMMKLDQSLAAVFSEQKKKTQAKKDEKSKLKKEKLLIRDFKIKVLDLVEVYVSRQCGSPLVLSLVQPLLTLIERCMGSDRELHEQDLLRRTAHILRNKLFRAKVYCRCVEDRTQELHDLLETLLHKTLKLHDSSVALYYFSACLYLVKVLRGAPPSKDSEEDTADSVRWMGSVDQQRVSSLFRAALSSFFSRRKTPLTTQMFSDLFTRFPVLCVDLLDTAVENITAGVREHQRGQACVLVQQALQNRDVQMLLTGDPWTQLCTRVTDQLVLSVQQMCGSEQKALKDKLQQVLELCQCVLGHAHRQKLPLSLEPLQTSLQELSSTVNLNRTGRLEDTYWAVMRRFGVLKPKAEKVKPNPADEPKTAPKRKKKGFLPETKKRKKRKVLETTDSTGNIQEAHKQSNKDSKKESKKDSRKDFKKKAKKRPAGTVSVQDSPPKKSKPLQKKKKKEKGKGQKSQTHG
ncbi:myb-binding protein 1A-like protein isoform X2 [Boleophthalmus pectinirostris]|uniref:myb-binding protein 1A-like protein isoform X2 n=1 Tax=Boleophthalmus pectinirostris TaxID=150288 RepID=UPI00242B6CEC|nr:myb-binding protein 1A-like protein isoform X2 [Boleophthalmus pectinirostris]